MVISVIIVTYNGMDWIDKCLRSTMNSDIDLGIIVIDNLSTDGTFSYVKENFESVRLIQTGENLGFGRANNIGIQEAISSGSDAVFLLNQDAYLEPNTVSSIVKLSRSLPDFRIVSPLHYDGTGKGLDLGFKSCLSKSIGLNTTRVNDIDLTYSEVKFVNAACWYIPMEVISVVGGFNPMFPHYGEDIDFCNRVNYHGFKIVILHQARIFHDRKQVMESEVHLNKKKRQISIYVACLSIIMNPNSSLFTASLKMLFWCARSYFNDILDLRLSSIVYFYRSILRILGNIGTLLKHKRVSARGRYAFLKEQNLLTRKI
jgi:GT2 family glycosyltransferase